MFSLIPPRIVNIGDEYRPVAPALPASVAASPERPDYAAEAAAINTFIDALSAVFKPILTRLLGPEPDARVPPAITPIPDPVTAQTDEKAPIPVLSKKGKGEKAANIWSGFRQGADGNCVTVSAIKAAMEKFGQNPTSIYKAIQKTVEGYKVSMRDGFEVLLSHAELAAATRASQFVGLDKGMLKDANFLFAISAKRAQMENNDGRAAKSYSAAIRSLNDGEDERGAGEGFLRLGLKAHIKKVPVRELARGQLGMVNRAGHSVAVIGGREELWGRQGRAPTQGNAVALV